MKLGGINLACRDLLHKTKLEDFKAWLIKDGWIIENPKGLYEVLRATKTQRKPLIVFEKDNSKQHYTIQDKYVGLVYQFIKDKKSYKDTDQSSPSSHVKTFK